MQTNKTHKLLKIILITTLYLTFSSYLAFAQIFDTEQSPLSVKWRSISSNGFNIIFPMELEKDAQRMANTFSQIYAPIGKGLNLQKTNFPIVLQNRGTTANGFVQMAPKKSQFYTTPPQKFDSQDWLNNLAVHELRHIAQFDKFTHQKKLLFSQEIWFAYLGFALPTWFIEGDAVSIETSLTNAGRGKQPSWILPFRTSSINNTKYSYAKAYFGSQKAINLGYYQLGYLMTSNLRKDFGADIIDKLLTESSSHPFRLYPFSQSLKKLTGYNTKRYYQKTLHQLDSAWKKQDELNASDSYTHLNKSPKFETNYYFPTPIANGQLLAIKQSKATPPTIISIDSNQNETKLLGIAYQEQPWFSYGNNLIVWDEIRTDPRYKQRSYSVISTYNLETKQKKQLTFKTRLFSPTLSGDGKKLIAVQIDLSNQCNLVAIDPQSGEILHTYPNPNNLILQTPALNKDGSEIAFVAVSEKGKTLWLLDKNEKLTQLIAETNQQLGKPTFFNNKIAFNAHYSGLDNIYEIDIQTKKISALTSAKYGAFNPNFTKNNEHLVFNEFTINGYQIAKAELKASSIPKDDFVFFGESAKLQENQTNIFHNIPDSIYQTNAYRPFLNLFNFHSISPQIDEDNRIGLILKSNDLLNNLDLYGGVNYNNALRKLDYIAGFNFKSFYPVFSGTFKHSAKQAYYKAKDVTQQANWREKYFDLKATLPLSVNKFNHNYAFTATIGTSYTIRDFSATETAIFNKYIAFPMNYSIVFSHGLRRAERDLATRWGQSFALGFKNRPFNKNSGNLLALTSYFYFPGLFKNHTMQLSINQQKAKGIFISETEIPTVFGYNQINAIAPLANTVLFTYRFPILFPDLEISNLSYIRNVRGGVFAHYENIDRQLNKNAPKTYGFELRSSMNLLRYQPVVDLGARFIFVNKKYNQNPIVEWVFNYSF